jgi:hypothetical protein
VVQPAALPPSPPGDSSRPAVSGTAAAKQTLIASTGAWSGTPPVNFSFQWQRCRASCSPIAGATSSRYTATSADVGAKLAVVITAKNGVGTASAVSGPVGAVRAAPPAPKRVKAALIKALKRSAKASIRRLLRNDADTIHFTPPSAGLLAITWSRVRGAHRRVASAKVIIRKARTLAVTLTLTGAGRQLLQGATHLRLAATATFTPTGGTPAKATGRITLTP